MLSVCYMVTTSDDREEMLGVSVVKCYSMGVWTDFGLGLGLGP